MLQQLQYLVDAWLNSYCNHPLPPWKHPQDFQICLHLSSYSPYSQDNYPGCQRFFFLRKRSDERAKVRCQGLPPPPPGGGGVVIVGIIEPGIITIGDIRDRYLCFFRMSMSKLVFLFSIQIVNFPPRILSMYQFKILL